ncbi:bifunctional phosphoribosyl-AMP cyclohydrolase/phosphoribosyl-ATP diphosphatase HisIE [Helicobacter hepaticus]|jgi:phosphoribosyl-ATP pyrophosphohydrolase/phosphoribosyl-AMP cyclohydrolase|uniref:Histidine biosynthesis bifunctional protein HisIE n=1 Tax=Helicobacter hepaticus (strain ATCC 51449 / 3B1) TaxID=235279 RepID=HIS2_HELHP|nr:bifunctional phosphoribosyl-AMP cyclohydrolase/phosphoribosyl-ATP diphosphatase HisIE [Helicobacter hepaticus]Q7VJ02.1 RecName: Full=Histidine biosynthesis bifunctional protein HisIE; Includes: RecName: Full=Phosphoribosyl-AMP cyclohydrolase; Short=PRA-CH; Includes: RecName: Full=Phosphoribosyl-ATP pyrophosphatase; Short=PRA-PH [Helicobacter hepaticus ATCC 51449]AAP77046.1 phosphoribosyl-AMP cyclohydrolase/ phosphoribosyl-ATP pyrophosphohydrolase [Helicobacter hepaticus ATCC 51449]
MQDVFRQIDWERYELIPTIVQEKQSQQILMLAYSSKQSLELSLQTHLAHYFSRSKQRIWQKGEQSGHIQHIKEVKLDCDNDSLIFIVEQVGVACHTGEKSCFFRIFSLDKNCQNPPVSMPQKYPIGVYHILDDLYHIIEQRRCENIEHSYTASLLAKGVNGIGKKIIEEAGELCFALKDKDEKAIIYECADLFYHILVGLALEHITPERVLQELRRRMGQSGIEEKASRKH